MVTTYEIKLFLDGHKDNDSDAMVEGLEKVLAQGYQLPEHYLKTLVEETIINGHGLLKSKSINSFKKNIVVSMSETIGKFLFHRLFKDADKYLKALNEAKKEYKHPEILLEFTDNPESKKLAKLPWELIFCSQQIKGQDEKETGVDNGQDTQKNYKPKGNFIAQEIFISRQIKSNIPIRPATDEKWGKTEVIVAFLTKNTDGLLEYYKELKQVTVPIHVANAHISFKFLNFPFDNPEDLVVPKDELLPQDVILLTYRQLKEIFGKDISSKKLILHLVCDVVNYIDYENDSDVVEQGLFFATTDDVNDTKEYPLGKVLFEITNQSLLPKKEMNLVILQSWKDPLNINYAGFEVLSSGLLEKNSNNLMDVISMPYVLEKRKVPGQMDSFFFKFFYNALNNDNLSEGSKNEKPSIKEALLQVRKEIMPEISFGFPIHYCSGRNYVLFESKQADSANRKTNEGLEDDIKRIENIKMLFRHLVYTDVDDIEKALFASKEKSTRDESAAKEFYLRMEALKQLKEQF